MAALTQETVDLSGNEVHSRVSNNETQNDDTGMFEFRPYISEDGPRNDAENSSLSKKSFDLKPILTKLKVLKEKYRIRKVNSKAAIMVLIWTMITNSILGSLDTLIVYFKLESEPAPALVPFALLIISALFSGWLADTYMGHYCIAKVGLIVMFIATVLQTALVISLQLLPEEGSFPHVLAAVLVSIVLCLAYSGNGMLLVTLPQIGLDQMPDCTTANTTSFIAWFVASVFAGFWASEFIVSIGAYCIGASLTSILSYVPALMMGSALILDFILSPKWLIIPPKSPKSLKTTFKVIKFAKDHTRPVNRSAFTYWEEDIPPRMDLGKSKYGGPFSVEQVEDVKTLLRIIILTIPLWICMQSFNMVANTIKVVNALPTIYYNTQSITGNTSTSVVDECSSVVLRIFTYDTDGIAFLLVCVYEFLVYPFIRERTPRSIRRIVAATILNVILSVLSFFICLYYYAEGQVHPFFAYSHSFSVALLFVMLWTAMVEFICAQSPYNMRALLLGYIWCINSFTLTVGLVLYYYTQQSSKTSILVQSVVACFLAIVGCVVFCALARWYKGRVRDEIDTPYRWAEEAYDKYIENRTNRSFGSSISQAGLVNSDDYFD